MSSPNDRVFDETSQQWKESKNVQSGATGLPNLPNLHGYCVSSQSQYTIATPDYELLLDNDPTRWIVDIANESTKDIYVWNSPDNTFGHGWKLPAGTSKKWTFQEYLTLVTGQWFVKDPGTGAELGLTVCNIIRN